MQGKTTIIASDGTETSQEHSEMLTLDFIQAAVGGYIELVPMFTTFHGEPCVAWCNEMGKINDLPLNRKATELWAEQGGTFDYLLGPILIVTGDEAFRQS